MELPELLPRAILDRVQRILDYHEVSKHSYDSVRNDKRELDLANHPSPFRTFDRHPKVPLPPTVHDLPAPALSLLADGLGAVPPEQHRPPQDLQTLATWLYFANGITSERKTANSSIALRTCPSSGALFPFELYVAVFGIEGLEPGLYHYDLWEFSLRKLRDGHAALRQMRKGRPDLDFLKTVPAAVLVSTIFCRSTWKFRQRAYRHVMQDAGHLVQNLISAANALGVQTTTRLRLNDKTMRDLIGAQREGNFGEAEAVQAMVVWADQAARPIDLGAAAAAATTGQGASDPPPPLAELMPPIPRRALAARIVPYGSILAVHQDCTAPGVAVREIRPPLTELSPLVPGHRPADLPPPPAAVPDGPSLRTVLVTRRSARDFSRDPVPRDHLWLINRLAFRGGTFFPMFPGGPHVGLVRPYWLVHAADGMDSGVWYYDPPEDRWHLIRRGDYRRQARYLSLEQRLCGTASAVCFMVSDLRTLLEKAGPDSYRLAHLEAGIAAQRVHLASAALGLGSSGVGAYYDDDVRSFLKLKETGWEVVFEMAIGYPAADPAPKE